MHNDVSCNLALVHLIALCRLARHSSSFLVSAIVLLPPRTCVAGCATFAIRSDRVCSRVRVGHAEPTQFHSVLLVIFHCGNQAAHVLFTYSGMLMTFLFSMVRVGHSEPIHIHPFYAPYSCLRHILRDLLMFRCALLIDGFFDNLSVNLPLWSKSPRAHCPHMRASLCTPHDIALLQCRPRTLVLLCLSPLLRRTFLPLSAICGLRRSIA